MNEVIELSSSDDENHPKTDDILNKYKDLNLQISNSDTDDLDLSNLRSIKEKLDLKYNIASLKNTEKVKTSPHNSANFETSEDDKILEPAKPKKTQSTKDKSLKKVENGQRKAEKELNKAKIAAAKAEKQTLTSAHKNLKPDQYIKFITACIDSDLISLECASNIINILQASNINYKIKSNILPFTITWIVDNQSQLTTIDGQLKLAHSENYSDKILLIIMWNEFVELVHENNLINHFKTLPGKKIDLVVYGMQEYFKKQKSGRDKLYSAAPKVSKRDVDSSLSDLKSLFNISYRFLENPQDVSTMVLQTTKAISNIPYKLKQQEIDRQLKQYAKGYNKDTVRVDKNGNGLSRLWQQQLTQLPLVRLETAEAIIGNHPTPSNLMKAYEDCSKEGEKLLEDIPIRRAFGPLTSLKKIGPEFSKKMNILFTTLNPNVRI